MARHSIYRPLSWQEGLGYRTSLTLPDGRPQCRETVYGGRAEFHQCTRAGTVSESHNGEQMWFCAQHALASQMEREERRRATDEAEAAKRREVWRRQAEGPKFRAALEQIAAGHNDARTLAAEVLAEADAP